DGAVVADGQADHGAAAAGAQRGGCDDGRRHQRLAGAQAGRRGLQHGHRRHRSGQGSVRHHPDGRRLQVDRQGAAVGPRGQRQRAQVPAVPADRQHHGCAADVCVVGVQRRRPVRADGGAAAVGQHDHGHAGCAGAGHRGPHRRCSQPAAAAAQLCADHVRDVAHDHRPGAVPGHDQPASAQPRTRHLPSAGHSLRHGCAAHHGVQLVCVPAGLQPDQLPSHPARRVQRVCQHPPRLGLHPGAGLHRRRAVGAGVVRRHRVLDCPADRWPVGRHAVHRHAVAARRPVHPLPARPQRLLRPRERNVTGAAAPARGLCLAHAHGGLLQGHPEHRALLPRHPQRP
ncbi:hypothetical protein LPJ57_011384, partial [Coemansia sp. RSA 486]